MANGLRVGGTDVLFFALATAAHGLFLWAQQLNQTAVLFEGGGVS